ncbi:hypothetical protein Patl1_02292 [Pistacia atlantica]|uniref:Uncharacterized protein n=1 Tax=Pistacia atlantica TaxID=434234 RepID=A0ACC1C9A6_9ROSI|nr:hypothetical protein Patl1_02292 [Pistacia atlantica]
MTITFSLCQIPNNGKHKKTLFAHPKLFKLEKSTRLIRISCQKQ